MPAVLTHKTIMLLARERLKDIAEILTRKTAAGASVTDLEHRVLYLAAKAVEMMSDNALAPPDIDFPGVTTYATPLGQGVSRFAVMGSMGPDITGFSALLAAGNSWVFDTVHKGNPDQNREPVVARSTDFVLEFWRQVSSAIDSRAGASKGDKDKARAEMRAYVLGHLCHIAGDVISHPFINDIEWHLGIGSRKKFSHQGGEGSIDAKVAQQLLLRPSTREGQAWAAWWPTVDAVPSEFFTAYDAALEQIYNARTKRPAGFGAFEAEFTKLSPPRLTVQFVRDGYSVYRNALLPIGYGWGYWRWWAFLMPVALPLMALFPLALALPKGREFTRLPQERVEGDRPFSEVLTLPLALVSIVLPFYGIWLASVTTRGVEALTAGGLTTAIASAISAVVYLATLGVENLPWWLRWLVYFGIPVGTGIFFSITALTNLDQAERRRGALAAIYASPFVVAFFFALIFLILDLIAVGIGALASSATASQITFGVLSGIVAILIGIGWFFLARTLRDSFIPERPDPFPAERPHFVRLFDDTTLFHGPAIVGNATLAQRFFPSARRPLLKLWWEGGGDLYIRSRRFKLEFSFSGHGDPNQTVPAPITPMTAVEYAHFLTATVKDKGGATGKLKAAMAYNTDLDYELPPGATFADEGDPDEDDVSPSVGKHDELAAEYHKLGTSPDGSGYILYHAPKSQQATRFGRNGPVPFAATEGSVAGLGTIQSSGAAVTGTGTVFQSFFSPGDQLRAAGQVRTVSRVDTDTALVVSPAFSPDLAASTKFERISSEREAVEGYTYVAAPASCSIFGGDTIMDYAADIAAMLCLGATPHLLDSAQLAVPGLAGKTPLGGGALDPGVGKVYQVFRNWSLDRRRVNEWRMLVAGGARSEKGEAADSYDSTMTMPRDPGWKLQVPAGEQTARQLGWVQLLRHWLQMASDRRQNAADAAGAGAGADAPSNLALSRGMAFLFDMPDPQVIH